MENISSDDSSVRYNYCLEIIIACVFKNKIKDFEPTLMRPLMLFLSRNDIKDL